MRNADSTLRCGVAGDFPPRGVRDRPTRTAQHGYTQADTSAFDAESAERHYRELLALFDRNLRQ
jgi:dienelactone hydrolase